MSQGRVEIGQRLLLVIVCLYLPGTVIIAKQFKYMFKGIPESSTDQFRSFVCPDCIPDDVFIEWINHHDHRRPVVIRGYASSFRINQCFLIQQLDIPSVSSPIKHGCSWSASLYKHMLLVLVSSRSVSAGKGFCISSPEISYSSSCYG